MVDLHPEALRSGTVVRNYEIQRTLGKGGCAFTYCARNRATHELLAIKEFFPSSLVHRGAGQFAKPNASIDARSLEILGEHFYREAEIVSQFDHPHLVKGVEVFEDLGTAYLVMKYETGKSLRQCLREPHSGFEVTPTALSGILAALLDGLEYSHGRDCLHCDIKPSNIYIGRDNHAVLLDFGAARHASLDKTYSENEFLQLYTPHYAPFEQCPGGTGDLGPWTDIYQLSAVIYRCLTGGKIPDGVSRDKNPAVFWPLSEYSPLPPGEWPAPLLRSLDWGLELRHKDRPQTVGEWRSGMADVLRGMLAQKSRAGNGTSSPKSPPPLKETLPAVSDKTEEPERTHTIVSKKVDVSSKDNPPGQHEPMRATGHPGDGLPLLFKVFIGLLVILSIVLFVSAILD